MPHLVVDRWAGPVAPSRCPTVSSATGRSASAAAEQGARQWPPRGSRGLAGPGPGRWGQSLGRHARHTAPLLFGGMCSGRNQHGPRRCSMRLAWGPPGLVAASSTAGQWLESAPWSERGLRCRWVSGPGQSRPERSLAGGAAVGDREAARLAAGCACCRRRGGLPCCCPAAARWRRVLALALALDQAWPAAATWRAWPPWPPPLGGAGTASQRTWLVC